MYVYTRKKGRKKCVLVILLLPLPYIANQHFVTLHGWVTVIITNQHILYHINTSRRKMFYICVLCEYAYVNFGKL